MTPILQASQLQAADLELHALTTSWLQSRVSVFKHKRRPFIHSS